MPAPPARRGGARVRSEEHTSELQSRFDLVCRLLLEKKKKHTNTETYYTTEYTKPKKSNQPTWNHANKPTMHRPDYTPQVASYNITKLILTLRSTPSI